MKTLTTLSACLLQAHLLCAQVGHTTITFNDPTRSGGFGSGGGPGRQIQTELYYPATTAGDNVPLANGTYPIIVFGHGFAMAWDAYENIWEHYVDEGYVLAFPRTEGGLFPGPSHGDFALDLNSVTASLIALDDEPTSLFFDKLSGNSAIIGHSMGGGAAFLAASQNSTIKTVVGLAPAETNPSAITAAGQTTVPALIFSGDADGVTPAVDHHIPIYNALMSDCKSFVNIEGGAHCYFANDNFNCDFGESTASSGIAIDRLEQQLLTYSILDPWLAFYLKDDCNGYLEFVELVQTNPAGLEISSTCSPVETPVISQTGTTLETTTSGVAYQWLFNGAPMTGENQSTITPLTSGTYSLLVTFDNGCELVSNEIVFTAEPSAYLMEELLTVEFAPNPVDETVWIRMSDGLSRTVELYSTDGQLLLSVPRFESETQLFMGDFSPGMYLLKIEGSVHRLVKK